MPIRVYAAEFIGTLALTLGVSLGVARGFPFVPLIAAMTVGIFVYTVGPISGAHLNPAVTFGLWSLKKIDSSKAVAYILVQLLAGVCALFATWLLTHQKPDFDMSFMPTAGIGEILGGFILVFGVCSVVYGKVKDDAAGLLIGSSLLIAILLAMNLSNGVVNPAVAVALGVFSPMYLLGSIVGGILGGQTYRWLQGK